MRRPRLGVRSRLLLAIVAAVTAALAVAVFAFTFLLGQRLSASATSLVRAQAVAERSSLEIRAGALVAPDRLDSGTARSQVWVFATDGSALEAPRVPAALDRVARSLARGPERSLDVGEQTRLYAVPVVDRGVRYGTVVAAVSLDPYEETGRTALIGALALAALVLGSVIVLARWMLGRALLPVSRMTDDADTWSEHDLDRRFDLGEPYDELTHLAATLDRLLERIAATLRHEQRFTAELSHELRTPLARIGAETELMLRRERTPDEYRAALAAVARNAEQMTRTVEALVAAARQESGSSTTTSDARDGVRAAVENVRGAATAVDVRLTLPPEPVRVAADVELVERMLHPLVDNAVRYARSSVVVSLERQGAAAAIEVTDDGPGVVLGEEDAIFEPGARGSAAAGRADGAGLGLSLSRRLARSAGGEIRALPGEHGGCFTLRLPLVG